MMNSSPVEVGLWKGAAEELYVAGQSGEGNEERPTGLRCRPECGPGTIA